MLQLTSRGLRFLYGLFSYIGKCVAAVVALLIFVYVMYALWFSVVEWFHHDPYTPTIKPNPSKVLISFKTDEGGLEMLDRAQHIVNDKSIKEVYFQFNSLEGHILEPQFNFVTDRARANGIKTVLIVEGNCFGMASFLNMCLVYASYVDKVIASTNAVFFPGFQYFGDKVLLYGAKDLLKTINIEAKIASSKGKRPAYILRDRPFEDTFYKEIMSSITDLANTTKFGNNPKIRKMLKFRNIIKAPDAHKSGFIDGVTHDTMLYMHNKGVSKKYEYTPKSQKWDTSVEEKREKKQDKKAKKPNPAVHLIQSNAGINWESQITLMTQINHAISRKASAIVLSLNSGGGHSRGTVSQLLKLSIEKMRKNNIAFIGFVNEGCYSACMPFAAACDKVLISHNAGYSNVGTTWGAMNVRDIGPQMFQHKNLYAPTFDGIQPESFIASEIYPLAYSRLVLGTNSHLIAFANEVLSSRKITDPKKMELISTAKIFTSLQSVKLGLADKIDSFAGALRLAKQLATAKEGKPVDVLIIHTDNDKLIEADWPWGDEK